MSTQDILRQASEALSPFACVPADHYWLNSDATYSYCWDCVRRARWFELHEMGPERPAVDFFEHDEFEEEFMEGIDGGPDYDGRSEVSVGCNDCGTLLKYWLSSSGVAQQIEGWEPESIDAETIRNPSAAYELRELLKAAEWVEEQETLKKGEATARETLAVIAAMQERTPDAECLDVR